MTSWHITEGHLAAALQTESQQLQDRSMMENRNALNVLTKLKEFRDKKILCDLVFQINNTSFQAHKAVFAACSPKLANLILSHTDNKSDLILFISYDKSCEAFAEFLEYCYTGFIVPTEQNVHSLLDIGKNFLVDSLVDCCENYLQTSLSSVNYVSTFISSVKYGLASLEEMVISFIETNLASIVDQHELLNLRPQDLELFLSSGKMSSIKQEVKLSIIINWVGYNPMDRNKFLFYLLSQISWDHTLPDLLTQISATANIFTSNEFCLFQLLQSVLNSTNCQLGPFNNSYPRLYSLYSHMVEELALPKEFATSSSKIEDVAKISVAVVSQSEPAVSKKDAQMNTDVDSSYFEDTFTVSTEPSQTSSTFSTEEPNADSQKENIASGNENEQIIVEYDNNAEKDQNWENAEAESSESIKSTPDTTHRRKSRPRKIAVDETKVKAGRGRPRKSISNKENKGAKMGTDIPKKVEQNGTEKDEFSLGNELLNDEVSGTTAKQSTDNMTDRKKEENNEADVNQTLENTKPRIKLNLKLKSLKSTKSNQKYRKRVNNASKSQKTAVLVSKPKATPVYKCSYGNCSFSSKTEQGLESHIENVHNLDVQLHCKKCEYTTNQMRELCFHVKTHYAKPPYCCEENGCNQKFLRMGLLVRHQMTHMNERPYKCDLCSKSFGTLNQLRCHRKLHEGRQFECDICLKRFNTKGAMQQHRAIHFDNKPYLCDTCGFCTKHLSHLISHRKIHTGDVLRCTFPDCGYFTPKQAHMTTHINRHLNIRNHICQVCGKSFVNRSKLLRHERIHLKEKLYKCKQCDYQTSRLDRMKLHIESHGIKFKKKKYNVPTDDDSEKPEIDFHQLYEKVQSGGSNSGIGTLTLTSMADIKHMDAISLAASASMIVDNYTTPRLLMDPISGEAVTAMEESLGFQQGFERIHPASFDQL